MWHVVKVRDLAQSDCMDCRKEGVSVARSTSTLVMSALIGRAWTLPTRRQWIVRMSSRR